MGTVAAINLRTKEGKTAHIMNYHDGHVGSTGAMLVSFYNTTDKIKALIGCGDIDALEQRLPSKEFISTVEKEVSAGDTSKVPANPYNIYDEDDLIEAVKEHKCINCMEDYVKCRFDVNATTLPLFYIEDNQLKFFVEKQEHKAKKGFGIGEYTYLFDEKQGKWFITDEVGNILSTIENELKRLDKGWTVNDYLNKRENYRKRILNILKQMQNLVEKQNKSKGLEVKSNKVVQGEIKVAHRPQSVREVNDWLRRMNVASRFRLRTVQDNKTKCLALQQFTSNGKWKAIGKCGLGDYTSVIHYLQQFVPVDWSN